MASDGRTDTSIHRPERDIRLGCYGGRRTRSLQLSSPFGPAAQVMYIPRRAFIAICRDKGSGMHRFIIRERDQCGTDPCARFIWLDRIQASARVDLIGARIEGDLILSGASLLTSKVSNPHSNVYFEGVALSADRAVVSGAMFMHEVFKFPEKSGLSMPRSGAISFVMVRS